MFSLSKLLPCKQLIAVICVWVFCFFLVSMTFGDEESDKPHGVEFLFPHVNEPTGTEDEESAKNAKRQASLLKKLKGIEDGGDIDEKDKHGQTALMHAAASGNRLAVCWLVAKGADTTLRNEEGTIAAEFTNDAAMKNLLTACSSEKEPITADAESERPFFRWVSARNVEFLANCSFLVKYVRFGINFSSLSPSNTNLLSAKFQPEVLAFLIRHGFSIEQCDIGMCREATPEQLRLLLALGVPLQSEDETAQLFLALVSDDSPSIQELMEQHPDMAKNAEYYGHVQSAEAIQALLSKAGSPPDSHDLAQAVSSGCIGAPALKALLDINNSLINNEDVLGKAIDNDRADLIDILVKAGLDPNFAFQDKESMLCRAARQRSLKVIHTLLEAGADPNSRDGEKRTPLMQAGQKPDELDVMRELIQRGADVNAADCHGNTPLIFLLTRFGDLRERMQVLFDAQADVNACTNLGTTPLMMAVFYSAEQERAARSRLLLSHGAKIDSQDASGRTALVRLLRGCDDPTTLKVLLDAGANARLRDQEGKSPMFIAWENKREKSMDLLTSRGIEEKIIAKPDASGQTPLMRAALDPDGLGMLQSIIQKGEDVNERDKAGHTALNLIMGEDGDIRLRVNKLIDSKANVDLADNSGTTPLMVACKYKVQIKRIFRVRTLLAAMANPNVCDVAGYTAAMHLVSTSDDAETLKVLLDAHADPDIENKEGETVLSLARKYERPACIKLLEERGAKEPSFLTSPIAIAAAISIHALVFIALCLAFIIYRRKRSGSSTS